jgi:hypothetical protein
MNDAFEKTLGVLLLLIVVVVAVNFPDLKRYWQISQM